MDDWLNINENTDVILRECACDPKNISIRDVNNPLCIFPTINTSSQSENQMACSIWKRRYDSSTDEEKEKNTQHCICK